MKSTLSLAIMSVATAGIFAFTGFRAGSVKGTITPADGAVRAWIISSTDTLRANVTSGAFEIPNAKAGVYKLIIEAKPPYKNLAKEGVNVADGQPTDVGEIKLEQ